VHLKACRNIIQLVGIGRLCNHVDWHLTGSRSPKPSSTPWCATVLLAVLRVPGPLHYTSCPRRTTVGVPAVTIERSTPEPFLTAIPLLSPVIWLPFLLQDRHGEGLQPDSHPPQQYPEDAIITPPFAYLSFPSCPLACTTPPRRFSASWTMFCWDDFCFAYLDDILVSSRSLEHQHIYGFSSTVFRRTRS
jgi:hypothetical protein